MTRNTYLEFSISVLEQAAAGFYSGVAAPQDDNYLGLWWGQPGLTISIAPWSAAMYGFYGMPEEVSSTFETFGSTQTAPAEIHVAYNATTRRMWIRVRAGGVTYPWAGGGNPETNTSPTLTYLGSNPVYAGGTAVSGAVTIKHAADFSEAPPRGFVAGIPA